MAVGADAPRLITPLRVVEAGDPQTRMEAIARAVDEQGPDELVVGWPLNMDGRAGPAARRSEALADELRERFGLNVHLVDERTSSEEAESRLDRSGWTHRQKKRRRDALAAAEILKRFFEQRDRLNHPDRPD